MRFILHTVCFFIFLFFNTNSVASVLNGTDTLSRDNKGVGALLSNPETFLPVDAAYQLTLRQVENGIIAEWVIADSYFLYGEQFHVNVNGSSADFTKASGEFSFDPIFEKEVEKHYAYIALKIETGPLSYNESMTLAIRYQGCADAGLCYPPETKYFNVGANGITDITAQKAPKKTAAAKKTLPSKANTSWLTLLTMLGIAVIGGLILNIMPCVFPVLSLKALSLANHHDKASRIAHGWAYTLGCVTTFVVIAIALLVAREAGNAVGWGFQLQSPAVITFLTLLFFIMGLALSGQFELGGSLMGIGQQLTAGSEKKQAFFTGALATVVASPCTAPFMATALGYALAQPAIIALVIFIGLGVGMALPFLVLSYSPQLHQHLPQPGQWMETFKQALAFPLYLTSVWLLWVLGQQVGHSAISLVLVTAVIFTFLLWLKRKKPQWRGAIYIGLFLVASGTIINNQKLTKLEGKVTQYWQPYSANKLAELRAKNALVFVNLTADWCITCKFNEKLVLTNSTLALMQSKDIHLLEGDWTHYNTEVTTLLDTYGRGGVPLYLLFTGEPNTKAIVFPQILNPISFKRTIESL